MGARFTLTRSEGIRLGKEAIYNECFFFFFGYEKAFWRRIRWARGICYQSKLVCLSVTIQQQPVYNSIISKIGFDVFFFFFFFFIYSLNLFIMALRVRSVAHRLAAMVLARPTATGILDGTLALTGSARSASAKRLRPRAQPRRLEKTLSARKRNARPRGKRGPSGD